VLPLNAFTHVLVLLLLQDDLNKQLLKLLVAVVDAELLETATNHRRRQGVNTGQTLSQSLSGKRTSIKQQAKC